MIQVGTTKDLFIIGLTRDEKHFILKKKNSYYHIPISLNATSFSSLLNCDDLDHVCKIKKQIKKDGYELGCFVEKVQFTHGGKWYDFRSQICADYLNKQYFYVGTMDEQIKKVKKDIQRKDQRGAKRDIDKLLRMDKKQDAKIEKCEKRMRKK